MNSPVYEAVVADLDGSVGRILTLLDSLALTRKTVVLFTSDNGGLRQIYTGVGELVSSNAPLRDEKGTLYEGGIRVPMIVRWPGVVKPGTVCHAPTTTVDLLSTFCQVASAPLPDQLIDGLSLVPLLRDPNASLHRKAIYFYYPHYHHSRPAGAVRAGDWKLIEFFEDGKLELYHLRDDIEEKHDRAADQPAITRRLHGLLKTWRDEIEAIVPQPNRDYVASNHPAADPMV